MDDDGDDGGKSGNDAEVTIFKNVLRVCPSQLLCPIHGKTVQPRGLKAGPRW